MHDHCRKKKQFDAEQNKKGLIGQAAAYGKPRKQIENSGQEQRSNRNPGADFESDSTAVKDSDG